MAKLKSYSQASTPIKKSLKLTNHQDRLVKHDKSHVFTFSLVLGHGGQMFCDLLDFRNIHESVK